ncbi:hypothetical protein O181_009301 [Austropuccinia psidii MF-1]|uniref:Uncharacterized protein n=1 Tax=Austropuccinia psidii MF-1 TaxID=1389203 RepID=A0A9Q3GJD0_9BASI|nr:hypothetical protein [Austropuccinia psidii MF-1]
MSRPKKQNLTKANLSRIRPRTSQRYQCSSETSRTKSDQTEKSKTTKSSQTSTSRYSLRSQIATSTILNLLPFTNDSDSLVASDCSSSDNQDLNPMGDETPRLKKDEFEVLKKVITQTKVLSWYCAVKSHIEDSIIEYSINNVKSLGHIDNIISLVGGDLEIWWLIIKPFKKLENNEIGKDPFHSFPDLNCSILLDQMEDVIIFNSKSVLGHAASLKRTPGTFGINLSTICLVSLHSLVSDSANCHSLPHIS